MAQSGNRNRNVALVVVGLVAGMTALSFASVPLYQLFCQVTGYAGTPKIGAAAKEEPVSAKTVTVSFDANVNADVPWYFEPAQREITVHPGEPTLIHYRARNNSDKPVTANATFNVTPYKAAQYFSKVQCFCFTEQTLAPGEFMEMPVQFVVDPAMLTDPTTKDVTSLTLSYTFFRIEPTKKAVPSTTNLSAAPAPGGNG